MTLFYLATLPSSFQTAALSPSIDPRILAPLSLYLSLSLSLSFSLSLYLSISLSLSLLGPRMKGERRMRVVLQFERETFLHLHDKVSFLAVTSRQNRNGNE
jgi:hypothetical protein